MVDQADHDTATIRLWAEGSSFELLVRFKVLKHFIILRPRKAGTCIQRAPPPTRVRGWTRLRDSTPFIQKQKFHVEQSLLSSEINQQNSNISRGDARDSGGLSDGRRLIALEFLTAFDGETLDFIEVKVRRNLDIFQAVVLFSLLFLTLNIALVFNGDRDGLDDFRGKCSTWNNLEKVGQRELRTGGKIR